MYPHLKSKDMTMTSSKVIYLFLLIIIIKSSVISTKAEQIINEDNKNPSERKDESLKFNKIYNDLLIGFNCAEPNNISSHEFDTFEKCENLTSEKKSTTITLQILQHYKKYVNKSIRCSIKRTRKVSHCGVYHHSAQLFKDEYTLKPIDISEIECKRMYKWRTFLAKEGNLNRFKINLNEENYISYYVQGTQYASDDFTGS